MSTDRELNRIIWSLRDYYYFSGMGKTPPLYCMTDEEALKEISKLLTEATREAEIRGISKGKWYMLDEVTCEFSYPENTRDKLFQMFRGWRRKAEDEMEQLQRTKNKEEGASK